MNTVAIHPADFGFCLFTGDAVVFDTAGYGTFHVGIAKQHKVRTTAYNDAGAPVSQFLHNPAFSDKQHIVRRKTGRHNPFAVSRKDAFQPKRWNGLFV